MMRMVAREDDLVMCLKHAIGKIGRVDREVYVNGKAIAGVGDAVECLPGGDPKITLPPYAVDNRLMAGAAEVLVGGTSVVGILHATQHNSGPLNAPNGMVIFGSGDVFVGGNTAVGNVAAALAACHAAAMTRKFNGVERPQSYENCGCESMRQIVNGKKTPWDPGYRTEDEFLNQQIKNGNAQVPLDPKQADAMKKRCQAEADEAQRAGASMGPFPTAEEDKRLKAAQAALDECQGKYRAEAARDRATRKDSGGSNTAERGRMGESSGVPMTEGDPSLPAMAEDLGQGKGIAVPTTGLPDKNGKPMAQHIVVVAGVVVDDNGNPVQVIYNDSMTGCGQKMDAADFNNRTQNAKTNTTKDPVW